ncbi:MAG: acetolactate synthase-1/2/3 large subunit [Parasphingorhabdus sp.]|jgi:acetolactate synthase-1/2/3 large subunit
MSKTRGADKLVRHLAEIGVTHIFSLSGNQIMPVYDACIDAGIRIIHTRHEASAVFMADAWAQLTGQTGIALVTAAPGFGNALGALYSAKCAESPVLLLSGDSPVGQDGQGAFQELDQVSISSTLTKYSHRVMGSEVIVDDLRRCIELAQAARPGPVHMALPFDVLNQRLAEEDNGIPRELLLPESDYTELASVIAEKIQSAQRPLILTGPNMSATRRGELPAQLSRNLHTAVVCMESPRGMNDPSLGDFAQCLAGADLVVTLGKQIDFTLKFGSTPSFNANCEVIVIDPENRLVQQSKQTLGDRCVIAEQADIIQLAEFLSQTSCPASDFRENWRQKVASAISARVAAPLPVDNDIAIHPATLCSAVDQVLARQPDSILVCDGGEFGQWAQAYVSAPKRIINGISGAIGGGICYALAAKVCQPDAVVVALMGDGTVGFHLAEFETALRNNAPFIVVIGHDAQWNAEVQIQKRDYGDDRQIGCELLETRYDLVAQGMGCYGELVEKAEDIEPALERAIASGLPACINVRIHGLSAPSAPGH